MKKTILTTTIAASALFASSVYAEIQMYGGDLEMYPHKTGDITTNGKPWGGHVAPVKEDTVNYSGAFKGSWSDTKYDSYIDINTDVEMANMYWTTGLGATTATLTFSADKSFTVNGTLGGWESALRVCRGLTMYFKANEGVNGSLIMKGYDNWTGRSVAEATTLILNGDTTDTENGSGFDLEIGQGVTFTMNDNASAGKNTIKNNVADRFAGTLTLQDGGKFAVANSEGTYTRLDVYGYGDGRHNDIVIGLDSEMNVGTLAVKSNTRIQVAGTLTANTNVIISETLTLDMQGEYALVNFLGDGTANIFGENARVNIYNFKDESITLGYSDVAKAFVEEKFFITKDDGTSSWVTGLTLTTDGFVVMASVPEPAEWAAIFGGIALALAIYRRRK